MQEPSKTLYAHLPPAWTSAVLDDPNRFITRTNPSPALCAGLRLLGTTTPTRPTPMPPPMDAPDLRQLSRSHGATESACGQHDRVARYIAIIHHATGCRPNLAPGCHLCAPNATHSWSKHQLTHPESSTQPASTDWGMTPSPICRATCAGSLPMNSSRVMVMTTRGRASRLVGLLAGVGESGSGVGLPSGRMVTPQMSS